jgi:nickel superoxide dismutase
MSFLDNVFGLVDRVKAPRTAHAHCDVPCGLYDPQTALLAAKTCLSMVTKMQVVQPSEDLAFHNTVTRMITTKEEHAEKCKHELLILWTDYFKPPHVETFPELHSLFWNAAKLCSKVKQEVNLEAANQLVATCEKVVEMFAQTQPK